MSFDVPNLTLLRHFVTVAEEKGISRAAERLRISQPALSKSVRRLEKMLGTQLFERRASGTQLTATGMAFFSRAQVIGLEYEHAVQELANLSALQNTTIRVAGGPIWSSTLLPAAAPRFHQRFPRHRLEVQAGPIDDMIEDLRLGRIDIYAGALIAQTRLPGFIARQVGKAQLAVMCAQTHPLAKVAGHVDPRRLTRYPFVSFNQNTKLIRLLSDYTKANGAAPPRFMFEANSLDTCVELVRSSDYLFFETNLIGNSAIGHGLTVLKTEKPICQFEIGFLFRAGLDRLAAYNGLMKAITDVLDECGADLRGNFSTQHSDLGRH